MNRYRRKIIGVDTDKAKPAAVYIDVYDVLAAYEVTCPAIGHAVKKLLCAGQRGHKDRMTDIKEAYDAIDRAMELQRDRIDAENALNGDAE